MDLFLILSFTFCCDGFLHIEVFASLSVWSNIIPAFTESFNISSFVSLKLFVGAEGCTLADASFLNHSFISCDSF